MKYLEEAMKVTEEVGAVKYLECSARTQEGINDVFDEAVHAGFMNMEMLKPKSRGCCEIL